MTPVNGMVAKLNNNELPRFPAANPPTPAHEKMYSNTGHKRQKKFKHANVKYKGHLTTSRGKMPAEVVVHAISRRQSSGSSFK